MQVNRHVESFGAFEHWPEELVVEVTPVDVAVDECPLETPVADEALSSLAAAAGLSIGKVAKPRSRSG